VTPVRALAGFLAVAFVLAGPAAHGGPHPITRRVASQPAPKAGASQPGSKPGASKTAPKAGSSKTAPKTGASQTAAKTGAAKAGTAKPGASKAGAAKPGIARAGAPREAAVAATAPVPPEGDVDRERTLRMQAALREILSESALRRTRVGIRVMEARTGRLMFEERGTTLMDPASNQKVLATTTALVRLGADWRYRTELTGPAPDAEGVIDGDVVLRGSGDPTVTSADLATMAIWMARRGAKRIDGGVIAEPRRIGSDQATAAPTSDDETTDEGASPPDDTGESPQRVSPRAPLVVNHGLMSIRVRPGASAGWPAEVTTAPAGDSFVIRNSARTKASGKTRVSVRLSLSGARIQVEISGKISLGHPAQVFRRRVPQQALYSAVLLRAALEGAGIAVRDPSRVGVTSAPRANRPPVTLLARHESAPLVVLLRRINKDSDNDQAERVLENAGAEVLGGAPTTEKGLRLLREVIGELGLPPASYVPRNGSGLGHANRITADAMADLLRALYLDPRVGPELMQSLSVGGLDGTTRNRFKGTLAARRVRAKTGTLAGKSCLSGLVGDGPDVLAFSILVQGLRGRHSLGAVRGAQVSCVNAMMRYVREAQGQPGAPGAPLAPPPVDIEAGEEVSATEGEATEAEAPTAEDPVDALLRQEQKQAAKEEAAGQGSVLPSPPAPSSAPGPSKPALPPSPPGAPPAKAQPPPPGAPSAKAQASPPGAPPAKAQAPPPGAPPAKNAPAR
jgi:PBP4 family serine-type D-alanyl-D-alanine carboxypeptidase